MRLHATHNAMTINELIESGKKGRDGLFKHRAASMLLLGMADARRLHRELPGIGLYCLLAERGVYAAGASRWDGTNWAS
jgi:hypothetical protein